MASILSNHISDQKREISLSLREISAANFTLFSTPVCTHVKDHVSYMQDYWADIDGAKYGMLRLSHCSERDMRNLEVPPMLWGRTKLEGVCWRAEDYVLPMGEL